MKVYTRKDVLTAAKERVKRIIGNFDNIVVSYSGGKDSEVTLSIVYDVAKEMGRLPINLFFLDQESEYQSTIDMVEYNIERDGIEPHWLQIPFKLYNSTNKEKDWFVPWEKGQEWMRPKHPLAVKENNFGTDRFGELFNAYIDSTFNGTVANFGGVRAEESPTRTMSLTTNPIWQDVTWGKHIAETKKTFYPLYDWSYTDIWKYIHEHGVKYNPIYDKQYQHGKKVMNMRVSSFIHENGLSSIEDIKEMEPDTWAKLVQRIEGINTQKRVGADTKAPAKLPYMFEDWEEYREHLLVNLIKNKDHQRLIRSKFEKMDEAYRGDEKYYRACVNTVIRGDFTFSLLKNFNITTTQKIYKGKK